MFDNTMQIFDHDSSKTAPQEIFVLWHFHLSWDVLEYKSGFLQINVVCV